MRNFVRAKLVLGAFSMLVGAAAFGCGGDGTQTSGSANAGGAGGAGQGGMAQGGAGGASVCSAGESQACYSGLDGTQGVGECKAGTSLCVDGQWGACDGAVLPSGAPDVCDGKDEDCNGQVDDGIAQQTCGKGACTVMVEGCLDGVVPACTPLQPSPVEMCDGTDDNCDGQVDEGCTCVDGQTQSCYSGSAATKGVGECKSGTQTCVGGAWGTCEGETLPAAEACDGLDNDCNTMADDNLGQSTCGGGACQVTVENCVNGVPQTCTPKMPTAETCNGVDDDCNLLIDDGFAPLTCGVGACAKTVPACSGGQQQICTPGMPMAETCNGADDNCNGMTDEGNPGGGGVCNTGLQGVCSSGVQTCTNGSIVCAQTVQPMAEACNGLDDNCDGMTDDGNPGGGMACMTGKLGVCAAGITQCTGGATVCNQTTQSSAEVCDGKDNNCNGSIDENNPGGGGACNTGLPGVCSMGTLQCQNGALKCVANSMPSAETCNGLDDNCNGMTDEGNPGGGMACSTGQLGVCAAGTKICQGGAIVCQQTTMAGVETCNGLDDNCNGTTDEGNPGGGVACMTGKPGICAAGTSACTAGAIVCNQTNQPIAEVCNNIDDDCNGTIDNGNPGGGAACSTGLMGVCAAGTNTCTNGAITCKQTLNATPEICDGKDNNCDGSIDNGVANTTNILSEAFTNNLAGWTLGTSWAIGATAAGPAVGIGNPDPATDHTPTADNGVAGVVLGGNYSTAAATPYYYLTSPNINTNTAGAFITLDFWRWLNTDYPDYVYSTIDVSINGGTTWTNIWSVPSGSFITDATWTNMSFDMSAYKSTTMKIRFGYSIGPSFAGAIVSSGWNVDDVIVRRCQ